MNPVNREKGAIVLPFIVAVGTIATLAGMVVESSLLLHARGRLFNDAEAAVLAAANLYAEDENKTYDTLNSHIKSYYCDNTFLDADATELDFSQIDNNIMVISSQKSIPFLFLPDNLITLTATVAASTPQPAGEIEGAAPLVMQEPAGGFVFESAYTLKQGAGNGTTGNFGALSLSGSGAADYENDLTNGYSGSIAIGDILTTKPGNVAGPTDRAVAARLATPSTDDDVVVVVITEDAWPSGRSSNITAHGFAAFRLTGSSRGVVTGTFIRYKTSAEAASSACDCDYGVYTTPKLVYY